MKKLPDRITELEERVTTLEQAMTEMKIWQTVTIGTHSSIDQLRKALEQRDIMITSYASDLLKKIELASMPTSIDLVLVTVEELGFSEGYPTTKEIYEKATSLGLELCPAEVGPILRLAYDQPEYGWLTIAMEPIADRHGFPNVFYLERHDDGPWLSHYIADPAGRWGLDSRFVFRLRNDSLALGSSPSSEALSLKPSDSLTLEIT